MSYFDIIVFVRAFCGKEIGWRNNNSYLNYHRDNDRLGSGNRLSSTLQSVDTNGKSTQVFMETKALLGFTDRSFDDIKN